MKKLISMFVALLLVLGFVGCNNNGSEIDVEMKEFIAAPTNLAVSNTTLSWDAVAEARGYIVFVNGEEEDTVSDTSFDFSDIDGDKLIFQVKTRAPRGMQDSPLSVKIAYVADKEAEITAVSAVMTNAGMSVPEAFAEELVNKGMIGSDAESMLDELNNFQEAMDSAEDFDAFMTALNDLVAEMDNVEALVSAVVKTMLPDLIQEQITQLMADVVRYQTWMEEEYYNEDYYQMLIDSTNDQIDALEALLAEIEDNPDAIVLSVTSTVDYFISIEEMIGQDLIDAITNLSEVEEASQLSVSELVLVKDEIVNILRETLPSEESMVLMMDVFELLMQVGGTMMSAPELDIDNYKGKVAAQNLYTIEAFINFLDGLNVDFFTEMKGYLTSTTIGEPLAGAEVAILTIKYFDTFLDDNEALLDTISEVFTEEEREILFNYSKSVYEDSMGDMYGPMYGMSMFYSLQQMLIGGVFASADFQTLLEMEVTFDNIFHAVLDSFVETDGEILRLMAIQNSFYRDYWEDTYTNEALDIEYDTYTEFREAQDLNSFEVAEYVVLHLNVAVQEVDVEFFDNFGQIIIDSVYETLSGLLDIEDMEEIPFSQTQIDAAKLVVENSFGAMQEDALDFVQTLAQWAVDEEVFAAVYAMQEDLFSYYKTNYGDDYRDNGSDWYDSNQEMYMSMILLADLYDSFMTNGNRATLDSILDEVFTMLKNDDIQLITEMPDTNINDVEAAIQDILDYLDAEVDDIKNLDWDSLSAADKTAIETFMEDLNEKAMAIEG